MDPFASVHFRGVFRDYQQTVLDHLDLHLADRKIHIAAAPGSGKTVLGLELIRRLGAPALVLSPTVIIQQQWGQRFEELFLPGEEALSAYLSWDLNRPGAITSLTYQGLYAAWNRLTVEEEQSPGGVVDYAGLDLIACLRENGIRTVCLDEAHHLRTNWHRALEQFLKAVGEEISVISLTATPPYDSSPAEWTRYLSLCGEIDEEIAVPDLVRKGVLCPHQDFLFFSLPTLEESTAILEHRSRARRALGQITAFGILEDVVLNSDLLAKGSARSTWRWENIRGVQALLCLARSIGIPIPAAILRDIYPRGNPPRFTITLAQEALQFLLDHPAYFGPERVRELHRILTAEQLVVRHEVCLVSKDSLARRLTASRGKLGGIAAIAAAEASSLGSGLRMVILVDHIGKSMLPAVGSGHPMNGLDAVSVFETVRQAVPKETALAILTGTLLVLPTHLLPEAERCAALGGFSATPLGSARYSQVQLGGQNRSRVAVVTELFSRGLLQCIVGTKSLLGEGWDAPCINSLILATVAGSFVLSNQMRGRAIRRDPAQPDKVANIWHLVTVPPQEEESDLGNDFVLMSRRFACFMGPAYRRDAIESGIARIYVEDGPMDETHVKSINRGMLAMALDRYRTARQWERCTGGAQSLVAPEVLELAEVPYRAAPPKLTVYNAMHLAVLTAVFGAAITVLSELPFWTGSLGSYLMAAAISAGLMGLLLASFRPVLRIFSPRRYLGAIAKALLDALRELGEIRSEHVSVELTGDSEGVQTGIALSGGTLREKKLFCKAVGEMLSPFDGPRYLIIRQRRILFRTRNDFFRSYACPSVIAGHRKRVDVLAKHLAGGVSRFAVACTGNPPGRALLLKSLRSAYINRNDAYIESKRVVRLSTADRAARGLRERAVLAVRGFFKGLFRRFIGH